MLTRSAPNGVAAPPLAPGERRLAHEPMPDGGVLVATNQAVHVGAVDGSWQRIEWHCVRSVGRSQQPGQPHIVTLRLGSPSDDRTVAFAVRSRSRLADLIVELTSAATIVSRRVIMSDSSVATFAAHREPRNSKVTWSVEFDRDVDGDDPLLAEEVRMTLRDIRAQMGC